jgi:hypothetical protein
VEENYAWGCRLGSMLPPSEGGLDAVIHHALAWRR